MQKQKLASRAATMAVLCTRAKSPLCPIAFPQLEGNRVHPIAFLMFIFNVTTGWLLPRLSEFNAINKCRKVPWSDSLKLSKMQMIPYEQIKGSFLLKELEKGKEQKRKLQLMWDRESCLMLSTKEPWCQMQKCTHCCVPWPLLCAWGGGNSSGNIQEGSVQLRQVSFPSFQLWQRFSMYGLQSTDALWNASSGSANISRKSKRDVRSLRLMLSPNFF